MHRPGDLGGRLSGGALGLMLPATVAAGAAEVAKRVAEAVVALQLEHAGVPGGVLTVTLGAVCSAPNSTAAERVEAAEHAARTGRAA